jgi:hypothetical protein
MSVIHGGDDAERMIRQVVVSQDGSDRGWERHVLGCRIVSKRFMVYECVVSVSKGVLRRAGKAQVTYLVASPVLIGIDD